MKIAISGSRDGVSKERVEEILSKLLGQRHKWVLGGARGVDQMALEYLYANDEDILVIVPHSLELQPVVVRKFFNDKEIEVLELHDKNFPYPSAYYRRNREMIDRAEMLIAFPKDSGGKGGTWNAIDYAKRTYKTWYVF